MEGSGSGLATLLIIWAISMMLSRLFRGQGGPKRGARPRSPDSAHDRWWRPEGYQYRRPEGRAAEGPESRPEPGPGRAAAAEEVRPKPRAARVHRGLEADAGPAVEYLGSLGFESAEGVSMEVRAPVFAAEELAVAGHVTGTPVPASPAVVRAFSALRAPGGTAEGAAVAIVLSEILGPPRALKPRRSPVAERARRA